jgi:CRP-like cAMP-binding protein
MGTNSLYTLKSRVCRFQLDHTEARSGGRTENQAVVSVSSEMLSEYMAVTQRSVNRILKQLKDSGIIEIAKSHILIRDYQKLQEEERDSI